MIKFQNLRTVSNRRIGKERRLDEENETALPYSLHPHVVLDSEARPSTMTQDPRGSRKLLSILVDTLSSPLEAISALSHACMLTTGFRFLGCGEDHKAGPQPHPHHLECTDSIELEFDESNIQKLWTSESPSHHEFRYAHPQSSMQFIIKVSRMGGKTVIMGVAIGDDKTTSFDIKTEDFTSAAVFPWTTSSGQDVLSGFIGENRLKDLTGLFKINILQKLIPGLGKEGYSEEQTTQTNPVQRYT